MKPLDPKKVGVGIGAIFALWHALWAVLVATGAARPVMDTLLSLHFLSFSYTLLPFTWGKALLLVSVTGGIGFKLGWLFAFVWNRLSSEKAAAY